MLQNQDYSASLQQGLLTGTGDDDFFVAKYAAPPSDIPTVAEWGLIVMALLMVTTGTLVYMRRRPATV